MQKLFLGSLLVASLVINNLSFAEEIKTTSPKPAANNAQGKMAGLGLSEEKRKQVQEIALKNKEQKQQISIQVKEKKKAMKAELSKETLDYATLEKLNSEVYDLQKQQKLIDIKQQVELSKILTVQERKDIIQKASQIKKEKALGKGKN